MMRKRNDLKQQLKSILTSQRETQRSPETDKLEKMDDTQLRYQLNISNPNQCWQKAPTSTFRASN